MRRLGWYGRIGGPPGRFRFRLPHRGCSCPLGATRSKMNWAQSGNSWGLPRSLWMRWKDRWRRRKRLIPQQGSWNWPFRRVVGRQWRAGFYARLEPKFKQTSHAQWSRLLFFFVFLVPRKPWLRLFDDRTPRMWIGYEGTAYLYREQGRIILIMCCSSAAGCRHTGWVKI